MSKRSGNRTGREAKRRRRRHERRSNRPRSFSWQWERYTTWYIDPPEGHGPDQMPHGLPPRVGKTARAAEFAELWRSGRVVIPRLPPDFAEERPLTDAELALRYAWSEFNAGEDPRTRAFRAAVDEERARDWSATYLPARSKDET